MKRAALAVAVCVIGIVLWWATRDADQPRTQTQQAAHEETTRGTPSFTASGSAAPATGGPFLIVKVIGDAKPIVAAEVTTGDDATVLTDDDGIARIAGRPPGYLDVAVAAAGFASETKALRIEPGGTDTIVELVLARGALLSGVVVDEQGKRIALAKVQITRLGQRDDDPTYVTADATGTWETDTAAGRYYVNARADGYGPTVAQPLELDGATARRDVIVRVTAGGTLFGKVVDADGKPVAGAKISAQQEARIDSWDARTDALGRYELRGLPEGVYLAMRTTGHVGHIDHHAVVVTGQRTEQNFVDDDDRISGTVVDAKGAPLAGIWVTSEDDEVATDASGRFALVARTAKPHKIRARRDKHELAPSPELEVTGSAKDVMIVLADAATIVGRVVLDGKPVTDFAIAIAPALDEDLRSFEGHVMRAPDGRFTLRDVNAGTWRVVVAVAGCDVAFTEPTPILAGKRIDVGDIAVKPGYRITGRVHDAEGSPVANARVTLNGGPSVWDSTMQRRFEAQAETTSDAAGAFAFDGVSRRTTSRVMVRAFHSTHGDVSGQLAGDRIDLAFESVGGIDGVIEGFAGDETFLAAGEHVVGVDRAGEFHFDGLSPGAYRITESMGGHHRRITPALVLVEAGRRTKVGVQLDVRTVEVHVKIPSPCEEAVTIKPLSNFSSGASGEVSCDAKTAVLPYVAPGKYRACDWSSRCVALDVAASPSVQTVELRWTPE